MKVVTLRFEEDTLEQIDREADVYGFTDRSSYLRHIVQNRELPGDEIETARERLERMEQKLEYVMRYIDMQRLPDSESQDLLLETAHRLYDDPEEREFREERTERQRERIEEFLEWERETDGELPWRNEFEFSEE